MHKFCELRSVSPEPFEESTTISNFVDYFSSYVKNTTERKNKDDQIEWARFLRLTNFPEFKSDGFGLLIGRHDGVQLFSLDKGENALQQLFSIRMSPGQVGTMVPSPRDVTKTDSTESVTNRALRPLLALGIGCRVEFTSTIDVNAGCVQRIVLGGPIAKLEANNQLFVVLSSSGEVVVAQSDKLEIIYRAEGRSISLFESWIGWADLKYRDEVAVRPNKPPEAVYSAGSHSVWNSAMGAAVSLLKSPGSIRGTHLVSQAVSIVSFVAEYSLIAHFRPGEYYSEHGDAPGGDSCLPLDQVEVVPHAAQQLVVVSLTGQSGAISGDPAVGTPSHGAHPLLVFRLGAGPARVGALGASVSLVYRLHRGETPADFRPYLCSAPDCRLVAAESSNHTVHVWPLTPHGGPLSARLVCRPDTPNRVSRKQRSAGLNDSSMTQNTIKISSYTKLYPSSSDHGLILGLLIPGWSLSSPTNDSRIEPLYIIRQASSGTMPSLLQYDLHIQPQHLSDDDDEDEMPFEIKTRPARKWSLPSIGPYSNSMLKLKSGDQENNSSLLTSNATDVRPTPSEWYSNIEVSTQFVPTKSSIRKLDRFTISTYQTKQRPERSELLVAGGSSSHDNRSPQNSPIKLSSSKKSAPVNVPTKNIHKHHPFPKNHILQNSPPHNSSSLSSSPSSQSANYNQISCLNSALNSHHHFQLCNSYCGSSVGSTNAHIPHSSIDPQPLLQSAIQGYFDEHETIRTVTNKNIRTISHSNRSSISSDDDSMNIAGIGGARNQRSRNNHKGTVNNNNRNIGDKKKTTQIRHYDHCNDDHGDIDSEADNDDDDDNDNDDCVISTELRQRISSGGSLSWNEF